jgi:hypothetical protein
MVPLEREEPPHLRPSSVNDHRAPGRTLEEADVWIALGFKSLALLTALVD